MLQVFHNILFCLLNLYISSFDSSAGLNEMHNAKINSQICILEFNFSSWDSLIKSESQRQGAFNFSLLWHCDIDTIVPQYNVSINTIVTLWHWYNSLTVHFINATSSVPQLLTALTEIIFWVVIWILSMLSAVFGEFFLEAAVV